MTDWSSVFGSAGFVAVDEPVTGEAWDHLPVGGVDDAAWLGSGDLGVEDIDAHADDDPVTGWRLRPARADSLPDVAPTVHDSADDAAHDDGDDADVDEPAISASTIEWYSEQHDPLLQNGPADSELLDDLDADGFDSTDESDDTEPDLQ